MNQKAIELLSVNAVRDSIATSDFLEPFIQDNDKEPSWDGSVYIYKDKSRKKCYLNGRLSVQVKGTENDDLTPASIKYPISTIDLKNYLYDGGTIYFVVRVNHEGTLKQIYYVELTPIKIRILLSEAKDKKTKSVELKKFPNDSNSKAMIFLNCYENCQKQASFFDAKLRTLEELKKAGVLEGITIPVSTISGIDPKSALLKNEVYLYAKIKGGAIPQPIEIVPENLTMSEEREATISVGRRLFYTKVKQIRNSESIRTCIGDSLFFDYDPCKKLVRISFKETNSLRSLITDLDFFIAYIENESFTFNECVVPFVNFESKSQTFNVKKEKERLSYLKKVVAALDILGCDKDITVSDLSERDCLNIHYLVKAFVDKEPITGLKIDLPPIRSIDVGQLRFLVCLFRVDDNPGKYAIFDFFKAEIPLVYENSRGEKLPISQYIILQAEDLIKTTNIRYDVLLPSFQKCERHAELIERANNFLLELIKAYDMDSEKIELLDTAEAFANWIFNATEEELPYDVRLLNKLQIEKRKNHLSLSQVRELFRITESPNIREDVLVGAYLLLDQQEEAEFHFKKMDKELQEAFKSYPIYHFWNNGN